MMQPRSHMAQQRVIIIHCLYLAKLNPVLCIGRIAQLVEHLTDDLESGWFELALRQYFSSNYVRLLAYVFTSRDKQLE